jgi:hypothetical protein
MSDTEAMAASASPRKPMVAPASRSCSEADLAGGVAPQRHRQLFARNAAAVVLHQISRTPPASSRTVTWVAPASSALSTSSRTTEAGRSTTSPAAIWLISSSGRSRMGRRGARMEHGIHGSDSRWPGFCR